MRLDMETDVAIENAMKMVKSRSDKKLKKCYQCDYATSVASHLKTHMRRHSGEKSSKCDLCDYSSADSSTLKAHLKIHTGEKSFQCNQCNYASSRAGSLRKSKKNLKNLKM